MVRRTSLGALKLVAAATVAACGGASAPDTQNMVAEDQRVAVWDSAPVDYGAGPGVVVNDDVDGRESALGQRTAMSIAVPGGPADAHVKGVFGAPFTWPIIPIHSVLLPDGRVLGFGSKPNGGQSGQFNYSVWDPALGMGAKAKTLLSNTTGTDIFCAGVALRPLTGDVLMVGGDRTVNGQRNYANRDVNVFTPADNALTKQNQSMAYQRWYATPITTASGDIAVMGGRDDRYFEGNAQYPPTEDTFAPTPEVYNASTGWRTLTTATSDAAYGSRVQAWNYPRAWWAPNGKVVVFNVMGEIWSLDIAGTGTVTQLPGTLPLGAYMLPAAMYQPGKILSVRDAAQAVVVDLNGAAPVVTPTAPLSADRQFGNATILADGKVWVNGGSSTGNDLVGARYDSETWDPATGQWTQGATATKARLYHSISMLMPDGYVLTGAGGAPGPVAQLNAEIYWPPYLYKTDGSGQPAVRPGILTAPTTATWGQNIAVGMNNKNTVARMTLVRFGAVTHAFSNEQRFQDLVFTQNGKNISATLPSSANNAPPGFYMLFAIDAQGVPSKAKVLRLGA
ncbi:MAG: galactose oxidase early set domain-containing protein [Burkholderiaceae bacterium]